MLKILILILLFLPITYNTTENSYTRSQEYKIISNITSTYKGDLLLLNYVKEISENNNIDYLIVYSLIIAESGFDKGAISKTGAVGLFQITSIAEKCVNQRFNVNLNRGDVNDNIKIGILFLSYLSNRFDGDFTKILQYYNNGVNFNNATKNYYNRIMSTYSLLKNL